MTSVTFSDVLRPVMPFPPVADLDALHEVATNLALHMQNDGGTCPNYFLLWCLPKTPVMVLEARWGNDTEKEAALYFVRSLISEGLVNAYAFIGEAYAVQVTKQPGETFDRSALPRALKDDPNHYEILMSYAFDRAGGERATIYEFEPGKPETRKLSEVSGLKDGWHHSGRLWNLFIARA